jgi:DNA polymerase elongation subunit (family B)
MWRPLEGGPAMALELTPTHKDLVPLPPGTYVTFNGLNYDFPIMSMAFNGADNQTLKWATDDIILHDLKPWHIEEKYGAPPLTLDHIDLINIAPGQVGLKAYGGRLHSHKLQDLPIDPAASISASDRILLREYCTNDLQTTADLYNKLKPQIELREQMSRGYGIDLRSKSDAQIAEAVIRKQMEERLGHRVYRPDIHPDYKFKYQPPSFIKFQNPGMCRALEVIKNADMSLDKNGSVVMPQELESLRLRIGKGVYRMGIGGLHSTENCIGHKMALVDRDVTSYYPSIILNLGLYPAHLGPEFLEVYRTIYQTRLAAKSEGNKVVADALKIVLNGSFGKFGSKWSVLYSPELMIQVTLTGQLSLLMLIEIMEECAVVVVSANTDGVVLFGEKFSIDMMTAYWEGLTRFKTEETLYNALYQKDVNNYIAIKADGKIKTKGLYALGGLSKNPTNTICVEAVIAKVTSGVPVEVTILTCPDIRKFSTVRQVKGGAKFGAAYLGKAVRWYYAQNEKGYIEYATNGNKVARSDGARPIMELPDRVPDDLDYSWYIREANSILEDIGYVEL